MVFSKNVSGTDAERDGEDGLHDCDDQRIAEHLHEREQIITCQHDSLHFKDVGRIDHGCVGITAGHKSVSRYANLRCFCFQRIRRFLVPRHELRIVLEIKGMFLRQ